MPSRSRIWQAVISFCFSSARSVESKDGAARFEDMGTPSIKWLLEAIDQANLFAAPLAVKLGQGSIAKSGSYGRKPSGSRQWILASMATVGTEKQGPIGSADA